MRGGAAALSLAPHLPKRMRQKRNKPTSNQAMSVPQNHHMDSPSTKCKISVNHIGTEHSQELSEKNKKKNKEETVFKNRFIAAPPIATLYASFYIIYKIKSIFSAVALIDFLGKCLYNNCIATKRSKRFMKKFFKAFPEKYPKLWEFIKFVFTAFSTTILYYVIYYIGLAILEKPLQNVIVDSAVFEFLGLSDMSANPPVHANLGLIITYFSASFLSYVASYIMNRKVTFKSNSNLAMSTILYTLMVVVTTMFTAWFGTFATSWLASKGITNGFVINFIVPTVAMLIPFVWTYPFQKFVIYRNKKPAEETEAEQAEVKEAAKSE